MYIMQVSSIQTGDSRLQYTTAWTFADWFESIGQGRLLPNMHVDERYMVCGVPAACSVRLVTCAGPSNVSVQYEYPRKRSCPGVIAVGRSHERQQDNRMYAAWIAGLELNQVQYTLCIL